MALVETDAQGGQESESPLTLPAMIAGGALALGLGGLLWWRFGDAVYESSLMGTILSCF
jgi:hypothetical protein